MIKSRYCYKSTFRRHNSKQLCAFSFKSFNPGSSIGVAGAFHAIGAGAIGTAARSGSRRRYYSSSPLVALFSKKNSNGSGDENYETNDGNKMHHYFNRTSASITSTSAIQRELQNLQNQAKILNDHVEINLNSPKQISNALYKEFCSTNQGQAQENGQGKGNLGTGRDILQALVSSSNESLSTLQQSKMNHQKITSFQRDLAALVLHYRELKQMLQSLQKKDGRVLNNTISRKQRNSSFQLKSDLISREAYSNSTVTSSSLLSASFSTSANSYASQTHVSIDDEFETMVNKNPIEDETKPEAKKNSNHRHNHHTTATTYSPMIHDLFESPKSQIDEYWEDHLHTITKPSARTIVSQLHPLCPMGYNPVATPYGATVTNENSGEKGTKSTAAAPKTTAGKRGSLLSYVREQKAKYSDCIVLTRVGEFYEAFGIDALLLMEHCGLNSMAGKARAGCPLKNIQATLDCLTASGYRVAVYEEVTDTDASLGGKGISGGAKSRIKTRMLAQIVSPASPTYLYNLVLGDSGMSSDTLFGSPSARPLCGVISNAAGYTLVEVSSEERTVRVSERLTAEAVACRLSANPPSEPLFFVSSPGDQSRSLPFLPSNSDRMRDGPGSKLHVKYLNPNLYFSGPKEGVSEVERSKQCIVSAILQFTETSARKQIGSGSSENIILTHDDFILLPSSSPTTNCDGTFTNPLYVETATQLGLMKDMTIPNLVKHLLPDSAPLPTRRFLRRWLLTPPPPSVAASMAELVATLKDDNLALPPMTVPPVGKILSLIRAGQASAQIFRDILTSIHSSVSVLNMYGTSPKLVPPLMRILRHESGIDAQATNLRERCLDVIQMIQSVVSTHDPYDMNSKNSDSISSDGNGIVPPAFFERNEAPWRGRIKPENAEEDYNNVRKAASNLVEAIAVDFWGAVDPNDMSSAMETKSPIIQDIFNNLIALKQIPPWAQDNKDKYYHPRDRNGKLLRNRYTTARVEDAVSSYVEACDFAAVSVCSVLSKLSETLCETGHLPAISQAAHINLILSTATQHAAHANYLGWDMAEIVDNENDNHSFEFQNVWPYWMDKSECVLNSFTLDGIFILTAPNMSGKSTIMRSAAAAALLTNSGLCAPLKKGSKIPRFDNIFVRGASSDIPSENKSAFGAEMQDIAALLRACGKKSLIFVDELGRGTSPTDGAALAGAVLEEMAEQGMKGIFATHLHSILELPLTDEAWVNIVKKRMDTSEDSWMYKIVDGVCTDSMAFKTAAKFGIPERIIERAKDLSSHVATPVCNSYGASSNNELNEDEKHSLKKNNEPSNQVSEAISIVESLSGESVAHIPPNWTPPPSLEGYSCLYVYHVGETGFYVGETDSLAQRIRQHRSKSGWADGTTIAIRVEGGKTNARNLESLLIREFASAGLPLLSVSDGQKIRPRNRQM